MAISNKVLFSLSNMLRTFEVLIISVFLSRFIMDKNDLGELLQVIFISSIIVTIVSGLPLAMNFFYGKYSESQVRETLFAKFLLFITITSLAICLLLFILKDTLGDSFKNVIFQNHIYIILLFLFTKSINTIFPNYHYLKEKLGKYLLLYTLTTAFLVAMFIYDYYFMGFINAVIVKQLFYVELLRLLINSFIIDKKELVFTNVVFNKTDLIYIATISIGVILGAFNLYIDKYLIAVLLNPTEFVYYQNGAINLPFVNIITSSLFIASIPVFAELYTKGKISELVAETKKATLKCSFFLLPILVYCFFEAIPLIKILYGPDFQASGEVFQIYILKYILSVMAFSIFMGSIGLEKKSNLIIFLSAFIALILNVILIPIYGILGASWAIVIGSLSTIFISFYHISQQLSVNFYDYFPLRNYIIILVFSIVGYLPFYYINSFVPFNSIIIVSSFLYYLIILLTLNYHFKLFDLKKALKK